jgi:DNA-damage-inducible protein D
MEAKGLSENKIASKKDGGIAKKAKLELEQKTGKKIITKENYLPPKKQIKGKKK